MFKLCFKMQPLFTIKRILIWLCMCPPQKSTSKWKKRVYLIFAAVVLFSFLFGLMAHSAYIVKFLSTNFPGCLFAFLGVCGFWGVIYIMTTSFIMRQKISRFFENLTEIYESSKCSSSKVANSSLKITILKNIFLWPFTFS